MPYYLQLIQSKREGFTKAFQRIANYVESHSREIAFVSIQELSSQIHVSTATIYRFCQEIGLSGYAEFQKVIQEGIRQEYNSESSKIELDNGTESILVSQTLRNIKILQELQSNADELNIGLMQAANLIIRARRVYVIGLQGDFGEAYNLYFSLLGSLDDVRLLTLGQGNLHDELQHITAQDVLYLVSFRVYSEHILDVINCFIKANATVISLTDEGSPFKTFSTVSLIPKHETPSYGSVLKVTVQRALVLTITQLLREQHPKIQEEYI